MCSDSRRNKKQLGYVRCIRSKLRVFIRNFTNFDLERTTNVLYITIVECINDRALYQSCKRKNVLLLTSQNLSFLAEAVNNRAIIPS